MSMEIFILGLLLVIGIILILIEILFIPGTTIFGILGVISIFSSDYLSYTYFGSEIAIGYSILNSILSLNVSSNWSLFESLSGLNSIISNTLSAAAFPFFIL